MLYQAMGHEDWLGERKDLNWPDVLNPRKTSLLMKLDVSKQPINLQLCRRSMTQIQLAS